MVANFYLDILMLIVWAEALNDFYDFKKEVVIILKYHQWISTPQTIFAKNLIFLKHKIQGL